jgi:microcystin-dependent protein
VTAQRESLPRRHFLGRALAAWAGSAWLVRLLEPRELEAATELDDTPFIGEIRMFAGDFAPHDWALCEGQLLAISQNDTLFQLIGTTYGGDGVSTFALPDLRGRVPMHVGPGFSLGQLQGDEQITLTQSQIPAHSHAAGASSGVGASADPSGRLPARNAAGVPAYALTSNTDLAPAALLAAGGSSAHTNMQPYLGINFIISLSGIFPSQS